MTNSVDKAKRRFLTAATTVVGGVGAAAVAVPFLSSMSPSEKAKAAGAPVNIDISQLELGQLLTIEWRGKPVWIFRRSPETLKTLGSETGKLLDPDSDVVTQQPPYCKNPSRSIREELMVVVGICTHLGCSPTYRPDLSPEDLGVEWKGGFFCPCHGSKFDLAGRVFQGVPAPTNLVIPPYYFVSENQILIGKDSEGAA
jgi:ubiquinol-cytochrome c reductase iron-sulfur subunit